MTSTIFRIAVRKFAPFEQAVQTIWKNFCADTGCKLELEMVPMDLHPLYDSILGSNGLKNGQWDLAHMNTDWIAEAVNSDALEELSPWIAQAAPDDFPSGWSESLLNMQRFGDQIYGLPFHDGPECFIFRKDLFESPTEQEAFREKYGKPLRVPTTWDDLIAVAEFFTRPQENLYGTVFAAYPDGHNTVFDFCLQIWTRGGELLTTDGHININTPQAIDGMKFYRKALCNQQAIHPQSREFDSVQSGMAFAEGTIAMMVNWFGFASMCEVYEHSRVKGKVDIANVPMGVGGNSISLNAYWMYVIGKGSANKQLAYDFARYAISAQNDKLLTMTGGIGCRKSTWFDPEVNREVPYYHKLNELHQNTRSLPRMHNWSSVAEIIDSLVLEVMNTEKPIETILTEAQEKINHLSLNHAD